MALPTTDKRWIFKKLTYPGWNGVSFGNETIDNSRNFWFAFKQGLTTASGWTDQDGYSTTNAHPWTVSASSDASTADATDRWVSTSNLNDYSWIVLRQSAINPNFELCLSPTYNNSFGIHSPRVSHIAGFTLTPPLSPTTRPTAIDLIYPFSDTGGLSAYGDISYGFAMYFCMSTDGECTRVFVWSNNILRAFWMFEKPKNPVSGWNNPSICYMWHQNNSVWPTSCAEMTDNNRINSYVNRVAGWMYFGTEFYYNAAICQQQFSKNDITNEWQLQPMSLICTTPMITGRLGEIYDLWFVSTSLYSGVTFPENSSRRDFLVLSNVVIPWNQSYLMTTC